MSLLFIFVDGIGLGSRDPETNPFALAQMPVLEELLGGQKMTLEAVPVDNQLAAVLALDACMNIDGLPQSATGQASLLTGRNISAEVGGHYGPKPNQAIAEALKIDNIFGRLINRGYSLSFLNAYPPSYFEAINSGRRLYAAIPLAVSTSGLPLKTIEDLIDGKAISADFTAQGWKSQLGLNGIPVLTHEEAGNRMANLALKHDFTLFEYWLSDYAGHSQNMQTACQLLEEFDRVLGSLLQGWDDDNSLILITSDHGNMEDLSTRKHTYNPVPGIVIGAPELRRDFVEDLSDITGVSPAIEKFLNHNPHPRNKI